MAPQPNYTIWQWNCRGFSRKRAVLQQFLNNRDGPDLIALQETQTNSKLAGYQSFSSGGGTLGVTTLVKRNITVVQHDTPVTNVTHVLVELIPPRKPDHSLFVLNVYSSPKLRKASFGPLFQATLKLAGNHPVIFTGDFNAQHPAWGYAQEDIKGRKLWLTAQQCGLTLLTDPLVPTRCGNSVSRDTSPDLTFAKNSGTPTWINTQQNFGSDHYILEIVTSTGPKRRSARAPTLVDWDTFRAKRAAREADTPEILDIDIWAQDLCQDAKAVTHTLDQADHLEIADSRLLHLWEAKRGLENRLKRQRWNRNLRRRIARLNKEIEDHAAKLTQQNWDDICNQMDRNMGVSKTWHLLRHLLDPTGSRTTQRQNLQKLVHEYAGPPEDLFLELKDRYIGNAPIQAFPDYAGPENTQLDSPITVDEVRAEIARLNCKSATGPDAVSNKILRNLDEVSLQSLTEYMQKCWSEGSIPQIWKTAEIILIPKPGKALSLENLRPISLTSCVGKLMEHVVHTRLNRFMEENELYPPTMIGFRPKLSTQDVMLQLKHQIIEAKTRDTRIILGLDLEKAFDNVRHDAILENLHELGVGARTFNYIRDFLSGRKAHFQVGGLHSHDFPLGNKGTPQGSVLSPFLFNVAMLKLPHQLAQVPQLHHSLYADDITLWTAEAMMPKSRRDYSMQ